MLHEDYNTPMGVFFAGAPLQRAKQSLESLWLAHADKRAIKGVINTTTERGKNEIKKKVHSQMCERKHASS